MGWIGRPASSVTSNQPWVTSQKSEDSRVTYFGNVMCSPLRIFVLSHSSCLFSSLSYFPYSYEHLTSRSASLHPFLCSYTTSNYFGGSSFVVLYKTTGIREQGLKKAQFCYIVADCKEKPLRCDYLYYSKWNFLQSTFQLPGGIR
jgi:hypothetical protein